MFRKLLLLAAVLILSASTASAYDLKDLLSKGKDALSGVNVSDAISGVVDGLTTTDRITPADLKGTWHYSAPAVCFKSENLLKKAGGSAAAATIEAKLAPYYRTAGLDKLSLTVNADSTFTMQAARLKLSGSLSSAPAGSQANLMFNFKAAGKIRIGSMEAYITKSHSGVSVMFDVSKLIQVVKLAGGITNNTSLQSVVSLLESYDGICAGFKLKK